MHISEFLLPSNTILTKCTKMTEEGYKLHGMNGNADRNIKEECLKTNYGHGGRLKFFKDGKFILELERAREGERVSWVSVPRKTFWPPQGTTLTAPAYRQESSTSLSVSDDNSSIQSSPWQRDHSWKQANPLHNVSKEMMFCYWKPKCKILLPRSNKRRSPYSLAPETYVIKDRSQVKIGEHKRRSLLAVVHSLTDKMHGNSTSPRSETVVSPRKRFLREMEKDKIGHPITEEYASNTGGGCLKRSRNKNQQQSHLYHQQSISSSSPQLLTSSTSQTIANGDLRAPTRNSNYSITSLLAEDRKRSPSSSPGHYSPVTTSHYHTPGPDDRWYSESVDRLRSIELSQAEKHHPSFQSPYQHPHAPPSSSAYSGGPYVYNFPPAPTGPPPFFYGGRGYVVPAVYHQTITRRDAWIIGGSTSHINEGEELKDETVSDMPLNLSKHSG